MLIAGMALGLYVLRLSGFLLVDVRLSPAFERGLRFVPVAALAALVAAGLGATPQDAAVRAPALAAGGLLAWRFRRPWVCVLGGVGVYVLLGALYPAT